MSDEFHQAFEIGNEEERPFNYLKWRYYKIKLLIFFFIWKEDEYDDGKDKRSLLVPTQNDNGRFVRRGVEREARDFSK